MNSNTDLKHNLIDIENTFSTPSEDSGALPTSFELIFIPASVYHEFMTMTKGNPNYYATHDTHKDSHILNAVISY